MTLACFTKRVALCVLVALPCALPAYGAIAGAPRALTNAPRFVSVPAATTAIDFGVHLPLRNEAQLEQTIEAQSDPSSPVYRHWLTPAQFRANFGPTPATISRVAGLMRAQGFTVTKIESQLIHVRGTAAAVERAFDVHLGNVRLKSGRTILASREQIRVPDALAATGATVVSLGYKILPQPQSNFGPLNRYGESGPYWFDDLKQAYNYPSYGKANGTGMTIATVGYSDFSSADAAQYFGDELLGKGHGMLAPAPVPLHLVFGDSLPFNVNDGDSDEADLDVQQANGSAPGATVVGMAIPATDAEGFLYGYSYIVDNNNVDIVSTSYGECELFYTPAYNGGLNEEDILESYHEMFLQGNSQGITFIFSSGDDSGQPCPPDAYFTAGPKASFKDVAGTSIWDDDPNATSVGGTNLETVANPNPTASPLKVTSSAYDTEQAIADRILDPVDPYGTGNYITNQKFGSGGGPSVVFAAPSYQKSAKTGSTMRVDPDISMHMGGCPFEIDAITGNEANESCNPKDSFDVAVLGGQLFGLIGTSASAPEFAGLLAVAGQLAGDARFGNVNVTLYKIAESEATNGAYHQGIPGWNGIVSVARGQLGYNEIVGLGTPDALNFLGIPKALAAGNPQTPTNP